MMQQIASKTFDPFSKARKETKSVVWTKVTKYLKPCFGNTFHIDLDSYQLGTHQLWMVLSSKSQTSSNPTSSLKQYETNTNLHAIAGISDPDLAVTSGQNVRVTSSGQKVILKILASHFFKIFVQCSVNVPFLYLVKLITSIYSNNIP